MSGDEISRSCGFIATLFPDLMCLFALMRLFTGEDGYVDYRTTTNKMILLSAIVLFIVRGVYILHFSDPKRHDRTAKEVERALREFPRKWKIRIILYWTVILLFVGAVYLHIA